MTTLSGLITAEANSLFDYSTLSEAVATEARAMAARIRKRIESSYLDTGRDLLAIKGKLGHGRFGIWLNAEFYMTERTAQNFMNAASYANNKPETVSHLPAKAIYKLAAPSTPQVVQEEIEQRIAKGERPTTRYIIDRIAEVQDKQAKEAAKARKLKDNTKGKTEEEIKVIKKRIEKRENDQAARERGEREEAARLSADVQKAAQEAVDLLRQRLGDDFVRFIQLCKRARGDANARTKGDDHKSQTKDGRG